MKFSIWTIVAAIVVILIIDLVSSSPPTSTRTFCAYNRTFVEFEERGHVWGTLILDFNGKPIPCKEGLEQEIGNTI
jgi:hypothetical protein